METIEQALVELAAGRPVVVVDGEERENEGDLIVAADRITAATMAFVVRHTSGYVCVALPVEDCERLALPPAHHRNGDGYGTAYRVSVDAARGVRTGISGRDRAHTVRLLAEAATQPEDLTRPGHVVPLAARAGGVLERGGHTEAAVDLTRLAGLRPAGVLCEVVSTREPGRMARRAELVDFASEHGLAMITIGDLAAYRRSTETAVERLASVALPIDCGSGRLVGYRGHLDGAEHVAFVVGDPRGAQIPVHVHGECLLGDAFGSRACDCGQRLDASLAAAVASGRGVVVYARSATRRPVAEQLARAGVAASTLAVASSSSACSEPDPALAVAVLADLGVTSIEHLHHSSHTAVALDRALQAALTRGPGTPDQHPVATAAAPAVA